MHHRALKKDDQIAGVAADIEQADAQFALVGGKGGFGGGDRLKNGLDDLKPGAVGAGDGALEGAAGAGGDVQVHLQPFAHHADRIKDARLIVEDELAAQKMQNLAVRRPFDGAGAVDGAAHILTCRFLACGRRVRFRRWC